MENYMQELIWKTFAGRTNQQVKQAQSMLKSFIQKSPQQFIISVQHYFQKQEQYLQIYIILSVINIFQKYFKKQSKQYIIQLKQLIELLKIKLTTLQNINLLEVIIKLIVQIIKLRISQFQQFIQSIMYSSNTIHILTFLIFLQHQTQINPLKIKQYILFIKKFFQYQSPLLIKQTFKTITNLLEILPKNMLKKYSFLGTPLLQIAYQLAKQDDFFGMKKLSDIIDKQPKIFSQSINQLNNIVNQIFNIPNTSLDLKKIAITIQISLCKYNENIQLMTKIIFQYMFNVSQTITQQWMFPPQGFSQQQNQNNDIQIQKFGLHSLDQLFMKKGNKKVLPMVEALIQEILQTNEWRCKWVAIMCFSQIGQYVQNIQQVSRMIELFNNFKDCNNPKIKYAICHSIGQMSDDLCPKFQQRYKYCIQLLIHFLDDNVARVQSHSCSSLSNFIEGMQQNELMKYLDVLINKLIYLLKNGISLTKQSSLSALSSIAQTLGRKKSIQNDDYVVFHKHTPNSELLNLFQKIVPQIFAVCQQCFQQKYKILISQAIEALTLFAYSMGKNCFQKYKDKLLILMYHTQNSQFVWVNQVKTYLISGWQRLVIIYKEQLISEMPKILPSLYQIILSVFRQGGSHQDIKTCIEMINTFIKNLCVKDMEIVQKTMNLVEQILESNVKQKSKQCLSIITDILKLMKLKNSTKFKYSIKKCLFILFQLLNTENDIMDNLDIIDVILNSIQIADQQFLNSQDVNSLCNILIKVIKQKLQNQIQELKEQQDQFQDDQIIKLQKEYLLSISRVIGNLYKYHWKYMQSIYKQIIYSIISRTIQNNKFLNLGIFLLVDFIQYIPYEKYCDEVINFLQIFLNSLQLQLPIRQASAYGIGILFQKCQNERLENYIETVFKQLIKSLNIKKKQSQKQRCYQFCRDNIVSTMGKIIQKYGYTIQLLNQWIFRLPLKHDIQQAKYQHKILINIIKNQIKQKIISQQKLVIKLVQIFIQILINKNFIAEKNDLEYIKNFLRQIKSLPQFQFLLKPLSIQI